MFTHKLFVVIPTLILFFSLNTQAFTQDQTETILTKYEQALELDETQLAKFSVILDKYQNQLRDTSLTDKAFNVLMKKRDLAFFDMLTKEQFKLYKEHRSLIEPNLKYRFKKEQ